MTVICPTITVETPEAYARQLATVQAFAPRVHIDVADHAFTPRQLLPLAQVYFPKTLVADIHVMLQEPGKELMTLISLRPNLVILHAESAGDIGAQLQELQKAGIKAGIALLPDTKVSEAAELVKIAEHALIFAGHLGYQGGEADMTQLDKVAQLRALNPELEIAWDGGVNDQNAAQLAQAGVDVLNVGGFIHKAQNPTVAYQQLTMSVR